MTQFDSTTQPDDIATLVQAESVLVFSYGSNLVEGLMQGRCGGGLFRKALGPSQATLVGVVVMPGVRLAFRNLSEKYAATFATVVDSPGDACPGVLHRVTLQGLKSLDASEGVPTLYRRTMRPVVLFDSAAVMAYVYEHQGTTPDRPSEGYAWSIREGYESHGMDTAPLHAACAEVGMPFPVPMFPKGTNTCPDDTARLDDDAVGSRTYWDWDDAADDYDLDVPRPAHSRPRYGDDDTPWRSSRMADYFRDEGENRYFDSLDEEEDPVWATTTPRHTIRDTAETLEDLFAEFGVPARRNGMEDQ